MNREQRRRRAAMERSEKHVEAYVKHLPEIDFEDMHGPGVSHIVIAHDDWCELYSGRGPLCNCNPELRFFREPVRS